MSEYFETVSNAQLEILKSHYDSTEGMIGFEEAVLLYSLAKNVQDGCIVEVGSYRGKSAVFLGRGSLDGAHVPVYAIDPHKDFVGVLGGVFGSKDRTAFYKAMLDNNCSEIVSLINLSSEYFSQEWVEPIALLWIDGDHSYEGVKRDFYCWMSHLLTEAVVAFDDASDRELGPFKLIKELIASGNFEQIANVGKVVVLKKCQK